MPRPPKPLFLGPLRPNTFRTPKGRKPVYLPNFVITLLRTPFLPPTMASFLVPLNLNKLDLKDYLYHAYNIPVLSVRSFIQQQKVRADRAGAIVPRQNFWVRQRAIKKMTVEMDRPFVWPDEPSDLEPWDKKMWDAIQEQREDPSRIFANHRERAPKEDRKSIMEQAKAMREGKVTWRPSWEDFGLAREVEVDVDVHEGGMVRAGDHKRPVEEVITPT